MSIEVLANEIKTDTISTTALDVFTNYNPDNEFTDVSQVPRFRYTSLADLVSAYGTLNSLVYCNLGVPTKESNHITLQQVYVDTDLEIAEPDDINGEQMAVEILVKLSTNVLPNATAALNQYRLLRDIGLRLKYILDTRNRANPESNPFMANKTRRDPVTTIDNTISPTSDYLIFWKRSGKATASEQTHYLIVNFSRAYGY